MKRTIVSGGILALSLAVVLLAATASTASAKRRVALWCAPLPTTSTTSSRSTPAALSRGRRREGLRLRRPEGRNDEPGAGLWAGILTINDIFRPTISVSGDYTQTNNCPPTLAGPALSRWLPHHRHLRPHGHRAQAGHPAHRTRGADGGAHRQRGHHPTPPVLPLTLGRVRAGPPAAGKEGVVRHNTVAADNRALSRSRVPGLRRQARARRRRQEDHEAIPATKQLSPTTDQDEGHAQAPEAAQEGADAPKIKIKFTATDEFGQRPPSSARSSSVAE